MQNGRWKCISLESRAYTWRWVSRGIVCAPWGRKGGVNLIAKDGWGHDMDRMWSNCINSIHLEK